MCSSLQVIFTCNINIQTSNLFWDWVFSGWFAAQWPHICFKYLPLPRLPIAITPTVLSDRSENNQYLWLHKTIILKHMYHLRLKAIYRIEKGAPGIGGRLFPPLEIIYPTAAGAHFDTYRVNSLKWLIFHSIIQFSIRKKENWKNTKVIHLPKLQKRSL